MRIEYSPYILKKKKMNSNISIELNFSYNTRTKLNAIFTFNVKINES